MMVSPTPLRKRPFGLFIMDYPLNSPIDAAIWAYKGFSGEIKIMFIREQSRYTIKNVFGWLIS